MNYAFTNLSLLDGSEHMKPQQGLAVLTKGEKIEAIIPAGEIPEGYTVIDLDGAYLMPGLINMHVHLPASGKPNSGKSDTKKLIRFVQSTALTRKIRDAILKKNAKVTLNSGVTTLRAVAGVADSETLLRDKINSGKLIGPRILTANMAVSVPGGHMAGSLAYEAASAEEAAEYVRLIAKDKPDLIKLMITGGVLDAKVKGEPGELKMPPEYVRAACDEAHRLGLKVAAHVESTEGVRVALQNGVDTIEHGAEPDEEILRLFKETGATFTTTFSPALPYALFDRSISHASEMEQYNGMVVLKGEIDCTKACLENGIPVGLGTDTGCPYITQYDCWRELVYFARYTGVDNAFALHTATAVNAKLLGLGDVTGTVEPGKDADFLITKGNPLESLQALRTPAAVVARGHLIRKPKLKRYAEVDAELDKFL